MTRILSLIPLIAFFCIPLSAQINGSSPCIGLTLSGGGAKGLAHIGILKALDSAGVQVDYVSGTSMGSIIGGLYAVGYSGNEIEQLTRDIDWDLLLSNQISLRSIAMEQKEDYWAHAIEVPFENGKLKGKTGALESQELWLKLSELFFPVYRQKDFNQFYRPFRAVATNIESGEPFVMDKGEIITALRASMAIPAVFTAIEIDGKRLVDGGIVRNLPATEVKNMGADFVIASNVSEGMYSRERLTNPIQILTQIAFLKEGEDHKKQVAMSDFFITQALDPFSNGSFDKADAIVDTGIVKGNSLVPEFQKLADSLEISPYPIRPSIKNLGLPDSVFIVSAQVEGLEKEPTQNFLKGLKFDNQQYYTPDQISDLIRRSYGTLKYERIRYRLIPQSPGKAIIVFEVKETPLAVAKLSVHFNTFSGLSLIGGFSQRNILPDSRTSFYLNLGENSRFKINHIQYLGKANRIALISELQTETFEIVGYQNFKSDELYRLFNTKLDNRLQLGGRRKFTIGLGNRLERIRFTPFTQAQVEIDGRNNLFATYLFNQLNTLDKPLFPNRGARLYSELRFYHGQKQRIRYYFEDQQTNPEEQLLFQGQDYFQGYLQLEWYKSIRPQLVFSGLLQGGFSTNTLPDVFNAFQVGGLTRLYRNQIVFPGLPHFSAQANNILTLQLNMRKEFANNLFLTAGISGLAMNHRLPDVSATLTKDFTLGQSLSVSYDSLMGPISFSIMYSGKVRRIEPYVNIGFSF